MKSYSRLEEPEIIDEMFKDFIPTFNKWEYYGLCKIGHNFQIDLTNYWPTTDTDEINFFRKLLSECNEFLKWSLETFIGGKIIECDFDLSDNLSVIIPKLNIKGIR